MQHKDHVYLLRKGIPEGRGIWADLGSGTGAFTLALADLLGPAGHIYSLDKDAGSLREQQRAMHSAFPSVSVEYMNTDFTRQLNLPQLDGILMANSLHYVRQKEPVLRNLRSHLRPGGRLIIVEYNVDKGNFWVPYPFSYRSWEELAQRSGFSNTQQLASVPSSWLREIYSALSLNGA